MTTSSSAKVLASVFVLLSMAGSGGVCAGDSGNREFIEHVSADIEALREDYAQLADYASATHARSDALTISYGFRTHKSEDGVGWTGGVPNPDEDGIWFLIDVHDPGSTIQLHNQPMGATLCLGDDRVLFLMLEGAKTRSVHAAIKDILESRGATVCDS